MVPLRVREEGWRLGWLSDWVIEYGGTVAEGGTVAVGWVREGEAVREIDGTVAGE